MAYIKRISDGKIFKVFGATRERQEMKVRDWSEVVTWFLIWEGGDWHWVIGNSNYVPEEERDEPSQL